MCMIISRWAKPKIAKKDIVVYKIMGGKDNMRYFSYYQSFVYMKDKIYTTTIERETRPYKMTTGGLKEKEDYNVDTYMMEMNEKLRRKNLVMYSKGFHSYASLARLSSELRYNDFCIVKCVIPAGALYMKSKSDLCISNQIIIKEDVSIDREGS